ncbi:hypothetical protein SOHN41_02099 [Shewanella sp. HN-41]|nr:hypothetical protein SOHN41_02099 [Shewanella sp. HN-41]
MDAALVKQLTTRGDCVRVVSRVSNKAKKLEQFMQEQQQFALKK